MTFVVIRIYMYYVQHVDGESCNIMHLDSVVKYMHV